MAIPAQPCSSCSAAPCRRAAELQQALDYLENLNFSTDDIAWLRSTGRFKPNAIDYFSSLRFTGDVHAMPEGTIFFANEPILRVTAPLPQAQLVETRLINILHFQSLVAAKAARCMLAAPRTWRRSRTDGGARKLSRRFCRNRDRAGRRNVRNSALRHHGPFVHRSV